ncbi:hypothetical protein ElyMa_003813100 [Elysia marginata]|uniref:Uncharacterized protein n=1 Tax=Elysia marginata TaxID=1093978 RepID=A0AAV4FGE4_9GAST|nr:hypothetical protein ElyMa_003813100 [Elysia marginata]
MPLTPNFQHALSFLSVTLTDVGQAAQKMKLTPGNETAEMAWSCADPCPGGSSVTVRTRDGRCHVASMSVLNLKVNELPIRLLRIMALQRDLEDGFIVSIPKISSC